MVIQLPDQIFSMCNIKGEHKVRPCIGFGHWFEFGFGLSQILMQDY
jgi:hypothetical protein